MSDEPLSVRERLKARRREERRALPIALIRRDPDGTLWSPLRGRGDLCAECGREFESKHAQQRYCSVLCRTRAWNRRRAYARSVNGIRRTNHHGIACAVCGGKTHVVDSRPVLDGIKRRRQCLTCGQRVTSYELVLQLDKPKRYVPEKRPCMFCGHLELFRTKHGKVCRKCRARKAIGNPEHPWHRSWHVYPELNEKKEEAHGRA